MTRRDQLIDWAIALAVLAGTIGVLAAGGIGNDNAGARSLDVLGVLLTIVSALPLAARRRAPLPVYAIVSAAVLALLALDFAVDVPLAPLVAVYTLGALRGSRFALVAAAAFVPATVAAYAISGQSPRLVPEIVGLTVMVAGVWIAGDRARLRRERMDELEERALRSEREAERERRLAAAEERTRIARELHDSAGHAINVILVQAGAARLLYERDPERSRAAIATVEQVARGTIAEIDRLVRALREDEAADPPADPALLEDLVERHRAGGLDVVTDFSDPAHPRAELPPSVAWAAYRILQEALTNAARHGRGAADVAVRFGADAAEITVTNPAGVAAQGGGHGIVGMRERATLLGGTLDAARENGTFLLRARLPYEAAR